MKAVEELSYEEAIQELLQVVETLEQGNVISLEEVVQLYERGQKILLRCKRLLNQAELTVKQISEGETQRFEATGEENAGGFAGE
jgi:exodeoxyribonuclease VII small subunit